MGLGFSAITRNYRKVIIRNSATKSWTLWVKTHIINAKWDFVFISIDDNINVEKDNKASTPITRTYFYCPPAWYERRWCFHRRLSYCSRGGGRWGSSPWTISQPDRFSHPSPFLRSPSQVGRQFTSLLQPCIYVMHPSPFLQEGLRKKD